MAWPTRKDNLRRGNIISRVCIGHGTKRKLEETAEGWSEVKL
jgi:hypothetical protein